MLHHDQPHHRMEFRAAQAYYKSEYPIDLATVTTEADLAAAKSTIPDFVLFESTFAIIGLNDIAAKSK